MESNHATIHSPTLLWPELDTCVASSQALALYIEALSNLTGAHLVSIRYCTILFYFFREISMLHMEALAKFKRSTPHLEFPALHKELFSVDS